MVNEPSVDELIRKLGSEEDPLSRYALCAVASKRARQILEMEKNLGLRDGSARPKELSKACVDIAEGRVVVAKD